MFLIILFTGILILTVVGKAKKPLRQCEKVHKWIIRFEKGNKLGYLICKECGKIPGND
jgi:hypothetical protein